MQVLKSRWMALAAICLSLTMISGCQIDGSTGSSSGDLTYIRVTPDLKLHAEPEGYIYQLWIFSIGLVDDTIPVFGQPQPLVRFKWDPYLYAATDENGNYLTLTSESGMRLDTSVSAHFSSFTNTAIAFLTLEPIDDPLPMTQNGPILLALNVNPQSFTTAMISPYQLITFFQIPPPAGSYRLLSQSNKKGTQNPNWRDNETEGYGIWFANPRLEDNTTLDSVNGWQAYTKTAVPTVGDAYLYSIWIHMVHPESSFSNFGRILDNREPNFEFRDGFPSHAPGRFGPSETINRPNPDPDLPGVQLGNDPVSINGQVVGYRYIITHPGTPTAAPPIPARVDTCIIRIDDPSLTRCNRDRKRVIDTSFVDTVRVIDTMFVDTFPVATFDNIDTLPKAFRITNGDTSMGPGLAGLLDVSNPEALGALPNGAGFLFFGWEYEAWLVFTQESGIPPMSLGRFKGPSGSDSGNPYTFTDSRYDRNFDFPGEDFLQNLSSHHPALSSPLDVIHDPRAEKIWITIEPDDDFGYDWAPEEPNTQFIYLSGYLPKDLDTLQSAQFPLVHRDLNPNPNGLNNGNFFPTVTVQFLPAPSE